MTRYQGKYRDRDIAMQNIVLWVSLELYAYNPTLHTYNLSNIDDGIQVTHILLLQVLIFLAQRYPLY